METKNEVYEAVNAAYQKYGEAAIDKVYHTETMYEMAMAADMEHVNLNDVDVLVCLIVKMVYTAAYWPHTIMRFKALKNLLRFNKSIVEASRSSRLHSIVVEILTSAVSALDEMPGHFNTPGHRQKIKNIRQVLKAIESPLGKCHRKASSKQKSKHVEL